MHQLKSLFYALLAFLAASSVGLGDGGAVVLRLPPIESLCSHADLYAAGLLVLVEVFSRLTPSPANNTISAFLARLLDFLLPNRAEGGRRFTLQSVEQYGPAA